MKLILNLNEYDYKEYLDSKVDILTLGLNKYSLGYLKTYKISNLKTIINNIHAHNKKIYICINKIFNEFLINSFSKDILKIKDLDIDGFVISDFGVLEVLKQYNLISKVIFNPITNITNKYCAKLYNELGINHLCIANELNINDILDISNYVNGNVEILAQGYYQICNSKRHLLTNFFKYLKIDKTIKNKTYYIQEESRDYAYPIIEINNELQIYIDKQRSIVSYFDKLKETNLKYIRIDTIFLTEKEIDLYIDIYSKLINNMISVETSKQLIIDTNSNISCLDNISVLTKGE